MDISYESLRNEINGLDPVKPADPAPTVPVVTDPAPVTPTEVDPINPVDGTEPPVVDTPAATPPAPANPTPTKAEESAQARAFAEMRVKNAKYEKFIAKQAEAKGVSVEDYLKSEEEAALAARATTLQTNPEVLRRLDVAEAALAEQEGLRVQNHIQSQFGALQQVFGLTEAELTDFTEQLAQRGHDFRNVTTDYSVLYRGLNHDKLVEKERQAWISRKQKADEQAPKTIINNGSGAGTTPGKINSISELDSYLDSQMPSKK